VELIPDPVKFFKELGGVHDANVEWLCWDRDELRLVLNNLNANFMDGLKSGPDYPGHVARPGTIVFSGIEDMSGHIRFAPDHISALDVVKQHDRYRVQLVGTETWMFSFDCASIALEPAGQPASVDLHYAALKA
jgi:hypothetical protein